jgi:hypothetical protein
LDGKNGGDLEILHGTQFRQRVEAVVEAFSGMKSSLDQRKKQIDQVIHNTGGMYGDLQGLVGASLPAIKSLELPLLEEGVST